MMIYIPPLLIVGLWVLIAIAPILDDWQQRDFFDED